MKSRCDSSTRAALKRLHRTDPYAVPIHLVNGLTRILKYKTGAKFPRHAKAIAAYETIGEPFWSQLFKFVFIRNPWDLQVSSWHHLQRVPNAPTDQFENFERRGEAFRDAVRRAGGRRA